MTTIFFSCNEKDIAKPDHLINRKKMIDMLVDVHLAKAYEQYQTGDSTRLSSTDLYYSVLAKYGVADSVFTRSVIYYSSHPKDYDKMYNEVLDRLNAMQKEQQDKQELNVGNQKVERDSLTVE